MGIYTRAPLHCIVILKMTDNMFFYPMKQFSNTVLQSYAAVCAGCDMRSEVNNAIHFSKVTLTPRLFKCCDNDINGNSEEEENAATFTLQILRLLQNIAILCGYDPN